MYAHGRTTERLLIRKLEELDIDHWKDFFIDNPSLPYLGIDETKCPEENAKEWIELQFKRYEESRYGHHALIDKVSGDFVGMCGLLTQTIEEKQEIEVGYSLIPKYWGHGYASEAARFFRDFGFENEDLDHIISVIDIRNIASQKVAVRNGMFIDRQIKYYNLDVYIYMITKNEWEILKT
ncbi:MAG: N-acetyltransferase [Marinilabiliales bacterium]|nr:MAG: N-acetyltransferase [Marinilabiliales bacterium]